jgi:hypothetical protein
METILANINHAIRNRETVTIGGGQFDADDLRKLVKLHAAAVKAKEALTWLWGGEPLASLEKEALDELRAALED